MNKSEMIHKIATKTCLPKNKVDFVFNEFQKLVVEVVNKGGEVCINGFGRFYGNETKPRLFRNPITKKRLFSQPKKQIKVMLSKKFRFSIK